MKTSYLTSIPTSQFYGSKPVLDEVVSFPDPNGVENIAHILADAESLFLGPQRVFLEIEHENGREKVDFHNVVSRPPRPGTNDDREGAKILTEIAATLPKALTADGQPAEAADHANFEVAGLLASRPFWETAERAMIKSLKVHSQTGDIQLESASQKSMSVTTAKDGKSLLCTISTNWHEFIRENRVHAMGDGSPVLRTDVKIRIPFKAAGPVLRSDERYDLEARIEDVHHHSPLPAMLEAVQRSKANFKQRLLNLLSNIPLLGRVIRGVALRSGKDFDERKWVSLPATFNQVFTLAGSRADVVAHVARYEALATHVVASRRAPKPNGVISMTVTGGTVAREGSVSLKAALDARQDEPLRTPRGLLARHEANPGHDVAALTQRLNTTEREWHAYADEIEARFRGLQDENSRLMETNANLEPRLREIADVQAENAALKAEIDGLRKVAKGPMAKQFETDIMKRLSDETDQLQAGNVFNPSTAKGKPTNGMKNQAAAPIGRLRANSKAAPLSHAFSATTTTTTTTSDPDAVN